MANKLALRKLARAGWSSWDRLCIPADHPSRPVLGPSEFWLETCWRNNRYSVQHSIWVDSVMGNIDHLWIRRHDGDPARSWADLQRIKNELLGCDRVALEIFPAVDDLVDSANMYHLWSPPAPWRMPFQLSKGASRG